jgi:hypothetical protein
MVGHLSDWHTPLDHPVQMPYNMGVINGTQMTEEYVVGIVIDVCSRSFLLLSNEGDEKMVECETVDQFMNVLEMVTANLTDEQIEYADLAIYENV